MVTLRRSPGDILKPDLEHYTRKTLVLQQSGDQRVHSPGRKEGFLLKRRGGGVYSLNPSSVYTPFTGSLIDHLH